MKVISLACPLLVLLVGVQRRTSPGARTVSPPVFIFFNVKLFFSFFQIRNIVNHTPRGAPLPVPKWLFIYNLCIECVEIQRHFQTQPRTQLEWSLLRWSENTLDYLPNSMDEENWDLTLPLPPPFSINADVDIPEDINFEVKYVLTCM